MTDLIARLAARATQTLPPIRPRTTSPFEPATSAEPQLIETESTTEAPAVGPEVRSFEGPARTPLGPSAATSLSAPPEPRSATAVPDPRRPPVVGADTRAERSADPLREPGSPPSASPVRSQPPAPGPSPEQAGDVDPPPPDEAGDDVGATSQTAKEGRDAGIDPAFGAVHGRSAPTPPQRHRADGDEPGTGTLTAESSPLSARQEDGRPAGPRPAVVHPAARAPEADHVPEADREPAAQPPSRGDSPALAEPVPTPSPDPTKARGPDLPWSTRAPTVSAGRDGSPSLEAVQPAVPIQVTIGRVEVRATIAAPAPAPVERPKPALSLDDYLASFGARR